MQGQRKGKPGWEAETSGHDTKAEYYLQGLGVLAGQVVLGGLQCNLETEER